MLLRIFAWFLWTVTLGMGCRGSSPTVHFTLPDDFAGAFLIVTGQADGVELHEKALLYDVEIPVNGVLKVKGDGPFYRWHQETASLRNGTELSVTHEYKRTPQDLLALWNVESGSGGRIWYFVGTKAERDKLDPYDRKIGGVKHNTSTE